MSGYATIDDVRGFLPERVLAELTLEAPPYESADVGVVEAAIYSADRDIDAHLARAVAVPFETPPKLIKSLSAKMAIHWLHVRRHLDSDVWGREYDRCVQMLQDIAAGKIGLDDGVVSGPPALSGVVRSRAKKYTDEMWGKF